MRYPTLEEVEEASHRQLGEWCRFLPSPGMGAIGAAGFSDAIDKDASIMRRILERFGEAGGWNPQLSKDIGWG